MNKFAATLVLLACSLASAQTPNAGAATAAGEIERLRRQKQANLQPETLPWLHRTMLYIREKRVPQKITYGYKGFRPRFGTLGPGSGFGVGIEYFRPNLRDERYTVRSSLTGSLQEFFMADGEFEARRIAGKAFVNTLAFHRFSPSIDFYGVGPSSSLENRTAYSLEENTVQLRGGWEFLPRLRAGGLARYFTANVGSTRRGDRPSTEDVFSGPEVPGLGNEGPYIETGGFFELLPRQGLGAPPGGLRALLRGSRYHARRAGAANFTRVDALAEWTQMFLNQQRAFVLRAHTVLSAPDAGDTIPFYLQPQLGGQDELRGFDGRRFYDNNLAAATAEYQWQIFSGFWLAAFADVGKVFPRWDKWSLRNVKHSFGFGIRSGAAGFAAGRFDIAFSREGSQFWIVFATF